MLVLCMVVLALGIINIIKNRVFNWNIYILYNRDFN